MALFLVFVFFIGGGFLIGKLIAYFLPDTDSKSKESSTFITHNYITENHLHVDKETLKSLTDKS